MEKDDSKKKPQRQRFIDTAKELEADETGEAFDEVFRKVVPPTKPKKRKD